MHMHILAKSSFKCNWLNLIAEEQLCAEYEVRYLERSESLAKRCKKRP